MVVLLVLLLLLLLLLVLLQGWGQIEEGRLGHFCTPRMVRTALLLLWWWW